jgi:uncharacterized membrane protein
MDYNHVIGRIGEVIDGVGVAVIAVGMLVNAGAAAVGLSRREANTYRRLRQQLGRTILLGLELLVAGDIVRTVATQPTLTDVAVLAIIVLIRTFLSLSLDVELTGRWPWQKNTAPLPPELRLRGLAHAIGHVDDPDDDPDQGHEHDGGQTRGPLEHDRSHRRGDQHGPEGQHDGLPTGVVGPSGPDHALLGPDHVSGPAALVPAPRVPVQLRQDAAVHLRRDPVVDLGRDPLVDLRADAFNQTLGQCLVIAGTKLVHGRHRGGDLSPAICGHHALRTFGQPFPETVRTLGRQAECG